MHIISAARLSGKSPTNILQTPFGTFERAVMKKESSICVLESLSLNSTKISLSARVYVEVALCTTLTSNQSKYRIIA